MKIHLVLAWLVISVLISSCQQDTNLEAEIADIQRTTAAQPEATNRCGSEGAEGYASFATEDARWIQPSGPPLRGREEITEWVKRFTELPDCSLTYDLTHVVVSRSGDIAYSVGNYKASARDSEGNINENSGGFVDVWQKQSDDTWKIAVAIWNTAGGDSMTRFISSTEEMEAVRRHLADATEINNRGDAVAWPDLFADDAVFMADDAQPITGSINLEDHAREWFDNHKRGH